MNNKILIPILMFFLILPMAFGDTGWRKCETGTSCTIGDFVYNENYTAYTNQICTINITHPGGSRAVTDGAAANHSDGWYSYDFTCTQIGSYRAEMYCINGTDIGRANLNFECVLAGKGLETFISIFVTILGFGALFLAIRRNAILWIILAIVFFLVNIIFSYTIMYDQSPTTTNIMLVGLNMIFMSLSLMLSFGYAIRLYKKRKIRDFE